MKPPLVSVIIPTFNRRTLLCEALESVSAQDGVRLEVIVVNDAGLDVRAEVAGFADRLSVSYLQMERNGGLAATRNAGIKHSSGDYIAYLDDDDVYLTGHLAKLADRLDTSPDIGLVYSDALLELEEFNPRLKPQYDYRTLAHEYDRSVMLRDSFICPSSMMHRRECVDVLGGFDENLRWCYEDWDFLLRVGEKYTIERAAGASVKIRLRKDGSNMSSKVNPHRIAAAEYLRNRYGCENIRPKTFWEVAETLSNQEPNKSLLY